VVTNGEHSAREGISRNWLNNIRKAQNDGRPEEGTLRVLLVASNTEPAIPGVDHEVDLLAAQIPAFFAMVGINVEVTKIPTEEATGERVCEAIRDSKFHVLHYAGHASFDATRTEKSSLYFWSKGNRQGVPEALGTHVLSDVLENSEIRLVYFSCCSSAGSGSADDAKKFSFLGMADAAISGKVPGIVGFRWPVTDSGAMALSREFYRTLAKDGELDSALMRARIALRQQLPDDPSWLSPILTVQL
jgi:CHAT domain-containing protein